MRAKRSNPGSRDEAGFTATASDMPPLSALFVVGAGPASGKTYTFAWKNTLFPLSMIGDRSQSNANANVQPAAQPSAEASAQATTEATAQPTAQPTPSA